MARRALTLTEMLVAMALLAAVVGIAAPFLAGRLSPATAEAVREQAASAVALCRLDAMREGASIRLVARRTKDDRVELVGEAMRAGHGAPERGAPSGDEASAGSGGPADRADARTDGAPGPDDAAGHVYLTLPARYSLGRTAAEALPEERLRRRGAGGGGRSDRGGSPARVTIALFLPDGSALVGDPILVWRDRRPIARWQINPWSGELSSEPFEGDPSDPRLEHAGADPMMSPIVEAPSAGALDSLLEDPGG